MPESKILVRDIMSKTVISVFPEVKLTEAVKLMSSHRFDGLPVVDYENRLIGIITEYNIISKGSAINIPTLEFIIENFDLLKKDPSLFKKNLNSITSLTVKDVMNFEPLTFSPDMSLEKVIMIFREHHGVNPIPVVSDDGKVIGVVSRFDLLKPFNLIELE